MAATGPELIPAEIGARVRMIRRRRGMSLTVAADRTGISKGYLSRLENGERRFERRGLLEDLARALSCSIMDLTGAPSPGDRDGAEALATLPPISIALADATLDDVPDVPARPVDELARWASKANELCADSRYSQAGRELDTLLTELHVHVVTGSGDVRRAALGALMEACFVACGTARSLGNADLAVTAARRGYDAARELDDPALIGFAAMTRIGALSRLGARHRAYKVADVAFDVVGSHTNPDAEDASTAEAAGLLHLSVAQLAAKDRQVADADAHLAEAATLAERTGERDTLRFSFGPANVRAWSLSIAVESDRGPGVAERIEALPGYDDELHAADRKAALHFDLARAYAQAEGIRDAEAVRHLDIADRIAPQRVRFDPVARELLAGLDNRARMRSWELGSLRNRFGFN
jgi:transcriptional regulator with XRE-family HTH domain